MCAVILAFASATQDIVVDAYRIEVLDETRMGAGASNYVVGYRIATFVSGAGALIIADQAGWFVAYAVIAALVLVGILATIIGPEPDRSADVDDVTRSAHQSKLGHTIDVLKRYVWMPFADFMTRRNWIAVLLFIALYLSLIHI